MDTMLSGLEFVRAYLDDILMNTQSAKQHKAHVHEVFKKIQGYRFNLKQESAIFLKKKKQHILAKLKTKTTRGRES